MSPNWGLIRVIALGVALALVLSLLWRQNLSTPFRILLIAVLALYAVRVYLAFVQHRRQRQRERGSTGRQRDDTHRRPNGT